MKITKNELKTIVDYLSCSFNVIENKWFYENQFCIIINDENNKNNQYRVFICIDDNCIIFQYCDNKYDVVIDLTSCKIATQLCHAKTEVVSNYIILITSVLNYYMNTLKYTYESEW